MCPPASSCPPVLAPAACLDFLNSEFRRQYQQEEKGGFTLAAHILRNERILDTTAAEYEQLPIVRRPLTELSILNRGERGGFVFSG